MSNFVYFLSKVTANPPVLKTIEQAKQDILNNFLDNQMKMIKSGSISKTELEKFLLSWNSNNENSIAAAISKELSNRMDYSNILTGAGFKNKFEQEVGKKEESTLTPNQQAIALYDLVQNQLQLYLDTLFSNGISNATYALIKQLAESSSTGKQTTSNSLALKNLSDGMAFNKTTLLAAENKFQSIIKELGNIMQAIASIGSGKENTTYKKSGTKQYADIYELANAAASSFSAIGGEYIYEPIAVVAANAVKNKVTTELEKTNNLLSKDGWKVSADWVPTQDSYINGHQGKNDMYFTVSNGSITMTLGGSIKLRQGKGLQSDGGFKRAINPQENFNLGQFIDIATNNTGKNFYEQYWSLYLTRPDNGERIATNTRQYLKPAIDNWNLMKQVGKYEAVLRILTGSGLKNDFASIFVVNNQIVSMYAILKKFVDSDKNNSKNGIWISGPGYNSTFPSLAANYRTNHFDKKEEAESKFYNMLGTIYSKKINIQVNMAKIMAI